MQVQSRPASDVVRRDWLGRRLDLRSFHRDPGCLTHIDPLEPCTCRRVFREADRILEWGLWAAVFAAPLLLLAALMN